jgi:di/tricarboxylate transporter
MILLGSLTVLVSLGLVDVEGAFTGFANQGLITVAVMFVVAEGLQQTGAVGYWVQQWLGQPTSRVSAQSRLMIPTAAMSAFLNNTPLVAILMPVINDWARKYRLSVSQLMLPLSYAAILGGLCTLVGTSTTLVVNGMMIDEARAVIAREDAAPAEPGASATDSAAASDTVRRAAYQRMARGLTMFELAWVGLPCCVVGILYVIGTSGWLLPSRQPVREQFENPREYTVEMLVDPSSPLVGRTIESAGLRHLPDTYLMEIERDGHILPAVSSSELLQAKDRLVFVGVVESVVDLRKIPGLQPATNQVFKLDTPRTERCLIEAVVSDSCPVIHQTIREARFRSRYNAAVIAVARNGERLRGKIGDIQLQAGDTLLLEAHAAFADLQRNSRDFYLVSRVDNSSPPRHERAGVALGILAVMVVSAMVIGMLKASLLAAGLMIITRCVRGVEARQSVDWSVLVTMGAGLGIGEVMKQTGTAQLIAETLIHLAGTNPALALAVIYGLTMVLTNLITAKAAAGVIFHLSLQTADQLRVNPMPFVIAVIIASATSLATPMGFQTNLMVYGPGGYRYLDYVRFGGPLSLILWALSLLIIPAFWPF